MEQICPVPFLQMVLYPNGDVTPCCFLKDYILGNIQTETLHEIWNSERARALRREFIAGKPRTCKGPIQVWKCNLNDPHLRDWVKLEEIQRGPIRKLDVRLNGQCNLECRMCDVWSMPKGIYDRTSFWKEAEESIFPHILELDVLGGEPFIQRDTYRLIEVVSRLNPGCRWMFTTNGHWKFTPYIREQLDRIELRWVTFSIDSLRPEVFAKIRLKGDLARTLRTLEEFRQYQKARAATRQFQLVMQMVVQKQNYREIPDFIAFARERGISPVLIPMSAGPTARTDSIFNQGLKSKTKILASLQDLYNKTGDSCLHSILRPLERATDPRLLLKELAELSTKTTAARKRSANGS